MRGPLPPRMMPPRMPRGSFPQMNRMGGGMRAPGPSRGGGGLLAKILGRGGRQGGGANPFSFGAASAAGRASGGGGLLKTLTDPSALNGFLTNTQKVLNTAQQVGPMVQQYGPIVRNLPSLWKLYKGFKDLPSDSEENSTTEEATKETKSTAKRKSARTRENKEESLEPVEQERSNKGQSMPKLYV